MIRARVTTDPTRFAARLAAKAAQLASARGETRLRQRRAPGSHWRDPHLLWALFAGGRD